MTDAATTPAPSAPLSQRSVEMTGITKSFFGTHALRSVDFSAHSGEVHALVGLNGAGKSTLMKILGGVYTRDEGEVVVAGENVHFHSPSDAGAHGIAMIHQEYSLIPELSVTRNIYLGRELKRGRVLLDMGTMNAKVHEQLERFDLDVDPRRPVRELNSGQRQVAEIVRALMSDAWLIVMDEPTSALSEEDKLKLFDFINRMKEEGIAIIYISHHMPEIFSIAERVTCMRDGEIVLSAPTSEATEADVINAMTGDELDQFVKPEKLVREEKVLEVGGLTKDDIYKDVSFTIAAGEIVAMTGLRGCGGPEIARALFGLDSDYEGTISYHGQQLKPGFGPKYAIRNGIGYVSENRDTDGILPPMAVSHNISMPFLQKRSRLGVIDDRATAQVVDRAIKQTTTKLASPKQEIRFLSGGNKQKVCFSRWLEDDIDLLILLEPTRGIDVHAKADIYRIIEEMAERGAGILIMSYEVDEVMLVADKVLTLYQGDVVNQYQRADMNKADLLADMAGAHATETDAA
jgi:ABC-type sugar transport system ATPase subunit